MVILVYLGCYLFTSTNYCGLGLGVYYWFDLVTFGYICLWLLVICRLFDLDFVWVYCSLSEFIVIFVLTCFLFVGVDCWCLLGLCFVLLIVLLCGVGVVYDRFV